MLIHPRFTPDFKHWGPLAYLAAVLQVPGRLAANHWAGRSQWRLRPVLMLVLLVVLATATLLLLQRYHPAWGIVRQQGPLTPAQVAQFGGRGRFWGVFSNLRQLLLLPLYALPTWLLYRRQGASYADALFMHILWNTAYNLYSLVLFALMAAQLEPITRLGQPLQLLLPPVYFVAVGYRGLSLSWPVATAKALLTLAGMGLVLRMLGFVGL